MNFCNDRDVKDSWAERRGRWSTWHRPRWCCYSIGVPEGFSVGGPFTGPAVFLVGLIGAHIRRAAQLRPICLLTEPTGA